MTVRTSDVGSHFTANLRRWVRGLGRGQVKRQIFCKVYSNRKKRWSVVDIAAETEIPQKQVVSKGREMHVAGLFGQVDGIPVVYEKIPEVHDAKNQIIQFADDPDSFKMYLQTHDSSGAKIINMSKITNNFRDVGVANTGRMSGSIRGTNRAIKLGKSATELLSALDNLKAEIRRSSLPSDSKEDALTAVNDLTTETKKPSSKAILSKVRNAVIILKALASGTTSLHELYTDVHPFIVRHFPSLGSGS